ncbi:hypothetical protein SAMN03080615_01230 [Amphritea atlantica]|uniref:Uncharacterized protein n=1 Tax=Amphritea atlantica TaxID=355243 RepID=A0A1H9FGK3_9GAMM|nr:hypothetical protein SAMN03080615_01230 [Amphritea atlantica]
MGDSREKGDRFIFLPHTQQSVYLVKPAKWSEKLHVVRDERDVKIFWNPAHASE